MQKLLPSVILVVLVSAGCAALRKPPCVVKHLEQLNIGVPYREVVIAKADGKKLNLKSDKDGIVVMPQGETYDQMSPEEKKRLEMGECRLD